MQNPTPQIIIPELPDKLKNLSKGEDGFLNQQNFLDFFDLIGYICQYDD